jgi:hypothetical protein
MANEFFVRKGLAIATSSVATASGASQSSKYLVVGDDNIVRWASASSVAVASPAFSFQINNGNSTAGLAAFGVAQFSSNSLHFNNSSAYLSGTSSTSNTLIGFGSGASMSTGSNNTFMGASAGSANTIGFNNTYIGSFAGGGLGTGSNNTFIGAFAGTASIGYNNVIAIGSYASPTADNQLVIASSQYPIGTASSGVFSHFLNTNINGVDVKIPIYL